MDKDELLHKIQDIVSQNPVVVLGSGASVKYGIAGMGKLADELKAFFSTKSYIDDEANVCVAKFIENLDNGMGLEDALLNVRAPEIVEKDIVHIVWKIIAENDKAVCNNFLNGMPLDLTSLFNFLIYNHREQTLNVVTTNYDRIPEYAASRTEAYLNTGFKPIIMGNVLEKLDDSKLQKLNNYIGVLNLWKIHGSLGWFKRDDRVYYIPFVSEIPAGFEPSIITPGTNKYAKIHQDPNRALLEQIDTSFKNALGYLCIGYGFNDSHVHPRILKYSKERRKPILIVTYDITPAIEKYVMIDGVNYIILVSDKEHGTDIYCSDMKNKINIPDKEYWNIEGLCSLIS